MVNLFGQKEKQLGKGENKMNKIKLPMIFLVVVALFVAVVVHATSDKQVEPKQVTLKAGSEIKTAAPNIPQVKSLSGSRQGYEMVTDVIDGFGGESESPNFKIPVNAGGQPSAIGISASTNYEVKAGFVYATSVKGGDANGDGVINIADVVYLLNYLFMGGLPPDPLEAGDANCDGLVNIADVVYLLNYLFTGGEPPGC
jgi:hypothetical protein